MTDIEKKKLIDELRATAQHCRPIVEGPAVKMENKRDLRRLITLTEQAASLMTAELEATKKAAKPAGKDSKGDDSKGAQAQG